MEEETSVSFPGDIGVRFIADCQLDFSYALAPGHDMGGGGSQPILELYNHPPFVWLGSLLLSPQRI